MAIRKGSDDIAAQLDMFVYVCSRVVVYEFCNSGPVVAVDGLYAFREQRAGELVKGCAGVLIGEDGNLGVEERCAGVVFGGCIACVVEVRHHAVDGVSEFGIVFQRDDAGFRLLYSVLVVRGRRFQTNELAGTCLEPFSDRVVEPFGMAACERFVDLPALLTEVQRQIG